MRLTAVLVLICVVIGGAFALMWPSAPRPPATAANTTAPRPDRQHLRADLMRAADRLEYSPCDQSLRAPLRAAIVAIVADLGETGQPIDKAATDVIRYAAIAGIIRPQEIHMEPVARVSVIENNGSQMLVIHGSPFVCRGDGADTEQSPDLPSNAAQ